MTLDLARVERLAVLAGIRLHPEEAERLARELSAVLEEIEVLREVELSGSEEGVGHVHGDGSDPAPDDRVPGPDPLDGDLSALAPDWRESFFVMPPPRAFREERDEEEGPVQEVRPPEDAP